jgi:CheY-like chemotaxis protein
MPDQPHGLLLCDDLLFTSRIAGTARALNVSMKTARSVDELRTLAQGQLPQGVILDLANPGLFISDLIAWLKDHCTPMPFVVGYGSHVDTATLKKAREAGCDVVLPRSKFVEDLPNKLLEWMR